MNKAGNHVRMAALFAAVCLLYLFFCRTLKIGEAASYPFTAFSIRFEYFGADAAEMERLITVPLEEKVGGIPGIFEIRSVSEYGLSLTTVYFTKGSDAGKNFLELRNEVDSLYRRLPAAVQKPRIYSSASEQKPVFSFALSAEGADLNGLRHFADLWLKPSLEAVEGAAEVASSGGSAAEVHVSFDAELAAAGNVNPAVIGTAVQDANALVPGAVLKQGSRDVPVRFDTRIKSPADLQFLPVPFKDGLIMLSSFAEIREEPRESDEIVRINGKECIAVSVRAAGNANAAAVAAACRAIVVQKLPPSAEFAVLYDNAQVCGKLLAGMAKAVLQSFFLVMLLLPLFFRSVRTVILITAVLPFSVLGSAAVLTLFGYPVDQNILSGLSVSLGLTVDAALIVAETAEAPAGLRQSSFRLFPALISSAATSLLVLIPLFFFDYLVPGIRSVVMTLALMLVNSLIFSAFFLPSFLVLGRVKTWQKGFFAVIYAKVQRLYWRAALRGTLFSLRCRRLSLSVYTILAVLPCILFFLCGKDTMMESETTILPFYVEFASEKSAAAIDSQTTAFLEAVKNTAGVLFVRSSVKKGVLEGEVRFAEGVKRRILAQEITSLSALLYDGFLYVPDFSPRHRGRVTQIEIAVVGDETEKCRALAKKAAAEFAAVPACEQTVLNFKEAEKTLRFVPDRVKLEKNGLSVYGAANNLRWLVFGPVIGKWFHNERETDIRVFGKGLRGLTIERAANIFLPVKTGSVRLDSLGKLTISADAAKIYRKDGRRAAYFTVHLAAKNAAAALAAARAVLSGVGLSGGYGFSFPRQLDMLAENGKTLFLVFLFCLLFIVILLTALRENLCDSLILASLIPVSVSLPLALRFLFSLPLTMGDITGMVIISGMGVNNAIYLTESQFASPVLKVRGRIRSILASSLTGITGSVPLLLWGKQDFAGSLGFFMFFGSLASLAASVLLFPALLLKNSKKHPKTCFRGKN